MARHVFLSHASDDKLRVAAIREQLGEEGFEIWWDRDMTPGTPFRQLIEEKLESAAAVVVFWTRTSVDKTFVCSEANRALHRGILVPVKLDSDAKIGLDFDQLNHIDLTNWPSNENGEFRRLVDHLRTLTSRPFAHWMYHSSMQEFQEASVISDARAATTELRTLTAQLRSVGEILQSGAGPAEKLKAALREVSKSYTAVRDAIVEFKAPGLTSAPIEAVPYLRMEGGSLVDAVEQGMGHCGRIASCYGSHGGLRDWLLDKVQLSKLDEIDELFRVLGTADGALFDRMASIAQVLRDGSRVIANLLATKQENEARERIIAWRNKLEPMEDELALARKELSALSRSLGYAEE